MTRLTLVLLAKELRETLRDRKTLAVMVLLPLALYPVLSVGGAGLMAAIEAERAARTSKVAVLGGPSPVFEKLFSDPAHKIELVRSGSPRAELEAGDLHAVVELPAGFEPALGRGDRPQIRVLYDAAEDDSRRAKDRIRDALDDFLTLRVDSENVASERRLGAFIMSQVLPFAVVFMVVLGAFYPAIDVTAGERERSTLETLLSAPVGRVDVVAGKFLAVTAIAITTGLLNLGSIAVTFGFLMRYANAELTIEIPWGAAIATTFAIVPAAAFFSALFLAVASLARSFKEAQNLLTPVYLVATMPAMAAALPGSKLTWPLALAPGANLALLAKDLVQGKAALGPACLAVGSTLAYAAGLIFLATRLYASERVLFADSDRELSWKDRLGLVFGRGAASGRAARPAPSAGEAMALLAINVVLLVFVAAPLQQRDMARGLLISQWGLLLGSTVLLLRASRVSIPDALLLRPPRPTEAASGLLAGLAAGVVVHALVYLIMSRLPGMESASEELARALFPEGKPRNLPIELFVFAVTPAVCEEVLFRGALLSGLRRALPAGTAIVVQALLFGLFHLSPFRLVPTTLLGLALGLFAHRTGSIVPGVLFHAANNAFAILAVRLGWSELLRPDTTPGLLAAGAAVPLLAGMLYWVARARRARL